MIVLPDGFKLIVSFLAGSHLYGNNTPQSDEDLRGVFIPTEDYFLSFDKRTEQYEDKNNDISYTEIRKFFRLCVENNPNIIEFLFVPDKMKINTSDEWEEIQSNYALFISKKCKYTFSGYAHSQFNRIKRHRAYLLNPPTRKPERSDFGLRQDRVTVPKDQIGALNVLVAMYLGEIKQFHPLKTMLDEMEETRTFRSMMQNMRSFEPEIIKQIIPGISDDLIRAIEREKAYSNAKGQWDSYQNWKTNRNPDRAILEEKFGYDCKHASHLYRLMTEGEELLTTGKITFPRPDAQLLTEIKNGKYDYETLISMVEDYDKLFDKLYEESKIQYSADVNKLSKLCMKITKHHIKEFFHDNNS